MTFCTNCGHELGIGRFCTNCGHPIDWRTDTAERPAVPPAPPPPPAAPVPGAPPAPPRYPLYADQIPDPAPPTVPPPYQRRIWPLLGWIAAAVVVMTVVAVFGVRLLTRTDDGAGTAADPSPFQHDPSSSAPPVSQPGELASRAEVAVPATAPPNQDVKGNQVRYDGTNMLDGVPETCWRMPGDGTGTEITLTLPAATRLGSVGIINGYAKSAQDAHGHELDWYHGNRRVLSVEWVFDDGTTVVKDLDDTTDLQSVTVDEITTTITVRLREVSAPGKGPAGRNYTAISELSVVGR